MKVSEFELKKSNLLLYVLLLSTLPFIVKANEVDFSLGTGYPFLLIAEASIATGDRQQRWFGNYKIGLDDGFSLGFEQGLGDQNRHALGLFVGALGVSDPDSCSSDDEEPGLINLGCIIEEIYDDETTNGLGVSYSYHFNGLNNRGARIRFELGYGEGVDSGEERSEGGISYLFQF